MFFFYSKLLNELTILLLEFLMFGYGCLCKATILKLMMGNFQNLENTYKKLINFFSESYANILPVSLMR